MKIVVLGGLGLQGQAALADLAGSDSVSEVICADLDVNRSRLQSLDQMADRIDPSKIRMVYLDASSVKDVVALLRAGVDAAIDLLPIQLMPNVFEAAIEARVGLVSTNYAKSIRHFHDRAVEASVCLMPECGLDPGIDLIIFGHAVRQFDQLYILNSYCGGFPEAKACDNPIKYKISWNWEMVLRSQNRPSVFIRDGRRLEIPAEAQHENEMIHQIDFPGLGPLEAIPNGDAVFYADLLGLTGTIRETGRYSLRWPGWCDFWRPLKRFGFLSDAPVPGLGEEITPLRFLVKHMEPRLRYGPDEKDYVAMYNVFEGLKDGQRIRLVVTLFIERDQETGINAMSMGVGFTASIVAQMIARGEIKGAGLLSPVRDVPYSLFMARLAEKGIQVKEWIESED